MKMEINIAFSTMVFTMRDDEELHIKKKKIMFSTVIIMVENTLK